MMKTYLSEFKLYLCNNWVCKFPSHTVRNWFYRSMMRFAIAKTSAIHMRCVFDSVDGLYMDDHSVVNANCRLDTRGTIRIGKNVSISEEVIILTADHDLNSPYFAGRTKKVVIEDYAWIGTRSMILPGVHIGKGAVVAAGAVVTKDVKPYTVVGGVPAKEIQQRTENLTYTVTYRRLFQ